VINPSASLSDRPPTFIGDLSSGATFQLNLQLSSSARSFGPPSGLSPACAFDQPSRQPSSQSPACAFDQPSGSTLRSTVDLRLRSTFRFRLCIDLRLAPPADPPAGYPTDLQLAPKINLQPNPPANHRLASPINLPVPPFASTCDLRRLPILRPAFQLTSSLRLRISLPAQLSSQPI